MTYRKLPATLVAIFAYAIMSGFFTQGGVILAPAAAAFGVRVTDAAALFSYLLAGNLVAFLLCLVLFDVLSIRRVLVLAYGAVFAGVAIFATTHAFAIACAAIALIGFGGGVGLSAGAVTISKTYAENRRAVAFLCTDCAFSVAGFIFPAIAAGAIARAMPWQSGYVVVAGVAALVLLAAFGIRFPQTGRAAARAAERATRPDAATIVRVVLFGGALCLYLCGQSTFTLWAPNYLQTVLAVPALDANAIIGKFWGPSIFGLIIAAVVVSRIPARLVLVIAGCAAAGCTLVLASTGSAPTFFAATAAFGFCSTCLYKLMISLGTEQVAAAPPQLVTFLLFAGALGGTIGPALSGRVVHALGLHAAPAMAFVCYAATLVLVVAALVLERTVRPEVPVNALSS
ncbi:MAG TPA: MFS transporter TsgA [Candidatus Limnocylindria bacterium]|nr:MFS transporter TsgA [Candidatus Limnocylindria bacterium]